MKPKIGTGAQRRAMKKTASTINRRSGRSSGLAPKYGLTSTSTVQSKLKRSGASGPKKMKGTWKIKRKFTG